MQQDIQNKLRQIKNKLDKTGKGNFLVVVDFAGTLFALGPDKDHIKDDPRFMPKDDEFLRGNRFIKGAIELDPNGCQNKKLRPFQNANRYAWTTVPSVAQLLYDIQGVNIVASSAASDEEQVLLQKLAFRDNHVHIDHIMTKDAEGIVSKGYHPSTIVVLGDTSSDVLLAERIAKLSPNAKVICGFTPSGMEQHKIVQETLKKDHQNIEFISGKNWSVVIHQLRKRLPLNSQNLHQFKKIRKQNRIKQRFYLPKQH